MFSYAFKHIDNGDLLAFEFPRQDRAAIDKGRLVHSSAHGHHEAGQGFVATGEADQRIVTMATHGEFDESAMTSRETSEDFMP